MSRIKFFARIAWALVGLAWCRVQIVCFEAKLALLRLMGFEIPDMPEWLKPDRWHDLSEAERRTWSEWPKEHWLNSEMAAGVKRVANLTGLPALPLRPSLNKEIEWNISATSCPPTARTPSTARTWRN